MDTGLYTSGGSTDAQQKLASFWNTVNEEINTVVSHVKIKCSQIAIFLAGEDWHMPIESCQYLIIFFVSIHYCYFLDLLCIFNLQSFPPLKLITNIINDNP